MYFIIIQGDVDNVRAALVCRAPPPRRAVPSSYSVISIVPMQKQHTITLFLRVIIAMCVLFLFLCVFLLFVLEAVWTIFQPRLPGGRSTRPSFAARALEFSLKFVFFLFFLFLFFLGAVWTT